MNVCPACIYVHCVWTVPTEIGGIRFPEAAAAVRLTSEPSLQTY